MIYENGSDTVSDSKLQVHVYHIIVITLYLLWAAHTIMHYMMYAYMKFYAVNKVKF